MKDKEVMQQVLNDICDAKICEINSMSSHREMSRLMNKAITALRERLAQEPVATPSRSFEDVYKVQAKRIEHLERDLTLERELRKKAERERDSGRRVLAEFAVGLLKEK